MELGTKAKGGRTSPRQAMKRLLRMIRRLRLAPGDRLPTQAEIRRSMGLSNFVIDDAMETLKGYGVLSRSRAAGTVLASLERVPLDLFNAGVLAMSPALSEASPFELNVFTYLTIESLKAGLGCRPFVTRTAHPGGQPFRETDFSGLTEAVDDHAVDLILTPKRLYGETELAWEQTGVPLVDMSHNNPACGVVVDAIGMAAAAIPRLHALGCRRLGIVSMHEAKPNHDFFWRGYVQGLAALGLTPDDGVLLTSDMQFANAGGAVIAAKYLALPRERRPDGLVVMDDRIGTAFERLLIAGGEVLPRMAVTHNIQVPLEFHSPVLKYGLDTHLFAQLAVEVGRARLLRPDLPPEVRLLPFTPLN